MEKIYIVNERTVSASKAMKAHRSGIVVYALTVTDDGELIKNIAIPGTTQPERDAAEENRNQCKHIAKEIEAYANGSVYQCPECGEEIRMSDNVGDKFKCPHCGEVSDIDEYEPCSVWDYLSDILDIEYRCGSDREYRSCKIMVACGGPNIYIDSADAMVKLYWWSEYAEYPLSYDTRDAIDEWAEEYWNI